MAWFAILFGTRVIDGPNRHKGMISAIALESLVKLLAFVAVGFFAINALDNPVVDMQQFFSLLGKCDQ